MNELIQRVCKPTSPSELVEETQQLQAANNISYLYHRKFLHFHKHNDKDTKKIEFRSPFNSATISKLATDKLPYSENLKRISLFYDDEFNSRHFWTSTNELKK